VVLELGREFFRANPEDPITFLRTLNHQQVGEVCEQLGTVQHLTDMAFLKVNGGYGKWYPPSHFGTAVHWEVKDEIESTPKLKKILFAEISHENALGDWAAAFGAKSERLSTSPVRDLWQERLDSNRCIGKQRRRNRMRLRHQDRLEYTRPWSSAGARSHSLQEISECQVDLRDRSAAVPATQILNAKQVSANHRAQC
jgi:hypothetical protein